MNNKDVNEIFNSIENERDPLLKDAGIFCINEGVGSLSSIQRKYKISSDRAMHIMYQLYDIGLVGSEDKYRKRKIYMSLEEFEDALNE